MLAKCSVFVVLLCITLIQCDVSHIAHGSHSSHSSVGEHEIEVLRKNITDYLVHLGNDGSPQMQLKHIFGASKQIVTGTVYTVQALLETADGAKQCEIRVHDLVDFCQVCVSCENGGQYEVTFNPHTNADASQEFAPIDYLPPQQQFYQPPATTTRKPFVYQVPTSTQIPYVYQDPTTTQKPFFYQAPTTTRKPFFYQAPTTTPTPTPFVYQFPTRAQIQEVKQPQFTQAPFTSPPFFQYTTPAPQPFYDFQPQIPNIPEPAPVFDNKPARPDYSIHQEQIQKPYGVPKPIIPPAPELNVLPYDQLPQGEALQTYLHGLFNDFMVKYNRAYIDVPVEREYRYSVFNDNFHQMHEHSKTDFLACDYSVTEFSDLTQDEYSRILGFDIDGAKGANITDADTSNATITGEMPEKYDQRDEKLVTRVKLQGDCGACWAFTTVAVIEGLCAKRTKKLQEFSEQSLLDCDNSNYGCKGGFSPNAIKHLVKRGGLELENIYPYVFAKSKTCKFDQKNVRVKVTGPVGFKKGDEEGMKRWLFKNGPILFGINAAPLKYYKGGVMNPTPALCNPKKIDHGVTLIGYGVEVNTSTGEKLPYWTVKNSWGPRWGEKGFFCIVRGKNACGLALWAYSAKLADVPNNCLLPNGQ